MAKGAENAKNGDGGVLQPGPEQAQKLTRSYIGRCFAFACLNRSGLSQNGYGGGGGEEGEEDEEDEEDEE